MDRAEIEKWLDGYQRAWASNDPAEIGALFTADARYFTAPFRQPWTGREAIVREWLQRKDEPGEYEFRYEVMAIADDLAFVRGWTTYKDGPTTFSNLWVVRLDAEGRCSEFTEWWMEHA